MIKWIQQLTKEGQKMSKKVNLIAISFVLVLVLIAGILLAGVLSSKSEVVSGTAGNFPINLANGGYVVEDGGYVFYTIPGEKGLYRVEREKPQTAEKINENADAFLQTVSGSYYYLCDDILYECDWGGQNEKKVITSVRKPLVVGSLIFYMDKQGNVCKYSTQNKTTSIVIGKNMGVQEFVVYYKKLFYTDKLGNIRRISFTGKGDELFIKTKASRLSISGKYFYYIADGKVCLSISDGEKIRSNEIVSAKEYAVLDSHILYTDGKNTYFSHINDLVNDKKPKLILKGAALGISIDEECFYMFDSGDFYKLDSNGEKKVKMN